jgi:hypothetical protein
VLALLMRVIGCYLFGVWWVLALLIGVIDCYLIVVWWVFDFSFCGSMWVLDSQGGAGEAGYESCCLSYAGPTGPTQTSCGGAEGSLLS